MPTDSEPRPTLKQLSTVLSHVSRWRILLELAKGQALPVQELAKRVRSSPGKVSKHMVVLREARLALPGFGRLYSLAPWVQVRAEERLLDLGYCLLRVDATETAFGVNPPAAQDSAPSPSRRDERY